MVHGVYPLISDLLRLVLITCVSFISIHLLISSLDGDWLFRCLSFFLLLLSSIFSFLSEREKRERYTRANIDCEGEFEYNKHLLSQPHTDLLFILPYCHIFSSDWFQVSMKEGFPIWLATYTSCVAFLQYSFLQL
jgi:hypothetical protein